MTNEKRTFKKIFSAVLCAAVIGCTAVSLPFVNNDIGMTVSAAQTYGDFEYNINDKGTVTVSKYKGSASSLSIPSQIDGKAVTNIGRFAFLNNSTLKSVTIPDTITDIEGNAFTLCTALAGVNIPSGVESIADTSFSRCKSLTAINTDSGNKIYASNDGILYNTGKARLVICPAGKQGIVSISDGTQEIAAEAFYGCTEVTEINVPDSVKTIGASAFSGCEGLVKIRLSAGLTELAANVLNGCHAIESVTVPEGVTKIGSGAFISCSSLKSVFLPSTLTETGSSIFVRCTSLSQIKLPKNLKAISESAFTSCTSLSEIVLPDGMTGIGNNSFNNCTALKKAYIPESVTSIGSGCFYNCPDLTIYGKTGSRAETYANENSIPFENMTAPLNNTSVINSDIVQVGDKVRISASANGGSGDYKYAYYYKRSSNNTWKILGTEFGTNASVAFAPTAEADFDIKVIVRDSSGNETEKLFSVTAVKTLELTNVSVVGREKINLGTAIPMIGKAVGGKGPFTYAFYFKRSANTNWKLLGEKFTSTASARFRPTATGTYDIRIIVKDSTGKNVTKLYTAIVK